MSRMASTESQVCTSLATQLSERSFPVVFLYLLKASSRIDLNCEEDAGVWECKDMMPVMGGLLVKMADWQGCVGESKGSTIAFGLTGKTLAPPGLPHV